MAALAAINRTRPYSSRSDIEIDALYWIATQCTSLPQIRLKSLSRSSLSDVDCPVCCGCCYLSLHHTDIFTFLSALFYGSFTHICVAPRDRHLIRPVQCRLVHTSSADAYVLSFRHFSSLIIMSRTTERPVETSRRK